MLQSHATYRGFNLRFLRNDNKLKNYSFVRTDTAEYSSGRFAVFHTRAVPTIGYGILGTIIVLYLNSIPERVVRNTFFSVYIHFFFRKVSDKNFKTFNWRAS